MSPRTYRIFFPSGQRFTLEGHFHLLGTTEMMPTIIAADRERAWALDPRAVILDDGRCIYDPRENPALPAIMRAWLAEHPEWPALTEAER